MKFPYIIIESGIIAEKIYIWLNLQKFLATLRKTLNLREILPNFKPARLII